MIDVLPEEPSVALDLPAKTDSDGQPAEYNPDEVAFMALGACGLYPPELFDTDTNHGKTTLRGKVTIAGRTIPKRDQIATARSICNFYCPVLSECAAYVTKYPQDEGVWAGTLPEERAAS